MNLSPLLTVILFLVGTNFSLQAFPMLGRGVERAHEEQLADAREERATQAAQQEEEAERRLSSVEQSTTETDSMENNTSIPSAEATTVTTIAAAAAATDEPAEGPGSGSGGSLEGHSVAAVPQQLRPHYRLRPDGHWEEQDLKAKKWEPTDRFKDDTIATSATWRSAGSTTGLEKLELCQAFTKHYNRADAISKRIIAYEQELGEEQIKNPSPERDNRIFVLHHLILVLNKARDYQEAMVAKLATQKVSDDPRTAVKENSHCLARASQINESPNKIEMIADQIEQEHHELNNIQMFSNFVQQIILAIRGGEVIPLGLQQAFDEAKTHQRAVIEATSAYAQCLRPPFEKIDEATQASMDEHLLNCRNEKDIVQEKKRSIWRNIVLLQAGIT